MGWLSWAWVTKTWELPGIRNAGGGSGVERIVVQLHHDTVGGQRRVVTGEGLELHRGRKLIDSGEVIPLPPLGDAREIEVWIIAGAAGFEYKLLRDGEEVLELMATSPRDRLFQDPLVESSIPSARVCEDGVVRYRVVTSVVGAACAAEVELRYSELKELHTDVCAAYRGSHLLENVPNLPPSFNRLWVDHTNADFVEERRSALERYVANLLKVPKLTSLPNVMRALRPQAPA